MRLLFGAALFALTTAAAAQGDAPSAALTLQDAVQRALRLAPPQRVADESVGIAEAQRDATRANLLPQLGVSASQLRQTTNPVTFGFSFPGLPDVIGPFSVFDARAKISQKLLDLAASSELTGAGFAVRAAQAQAAASRERLASQAALAYIEVLNSEQMLGSAKADLALADELLTLSRDQRGAGIASGVDVARAETSVAQDRYAVSVAEANIAEARLQLQRIAVLPMDQAPVLRGDLASAQGAPVDVAQALQTARRRRPELAAIEASIRQADAELAAAKRRRLPTVSLFADYGISANTPVQNAEDTYRYGASLDLPIYSGGALAAQESAARHQLEQQRAQLEDLRQQIEQDVRLAMVGVASTAEQIRAAQSARDLAERELEIARDRFASGVADNTDVITAQTSLARARAQLIAAQAAHQRARVNLAAAQGMASDFSL
ncbi:TolC family protein [Solimonas soli]|uniref:TolC family protein n=1 Tax=Solimonas soli TaxID=413479 RepID=UPI0004827E7F|nr:TolC family protein [Solimonas soli]